MLPGLGDEVSDAGLVVVLLLAVAGLVGGYVLQQLRRPAYAVRFTNVPLLAALVPKRPGWRRHAAFGLVALALAALIGSLGTPSARPGCPGSGPP